MDNQFNMEKLKDCVVALYGEVLHIALLHYYDRLIITLHDELVISEF